MILQRSIKITYLSHSGFLLETETADFIFDYYKGELPRLEPEKPLVVFVSHGHADHYNREIYQWMKDYPNISYILPKDIPTKRLIAEQEAKGIALGEAMISIRKNTTMQLELFPGHTLTITTLKSTDAGVAYLLEYEGCTIYHAGDLNLWYWNGESKQYNENMTKAFLREMEKLKGKRIDIAFVPLDPRLEEHSMDGLKLFLEYTDSRWVFPMHMWGEYHIITELKKKYPQYQNRIADISYEGQVFQQSIALTGQ